jgi:hypothetical protein
MTHDPRPNGPSKAEERSIRVSNTARNLIVTAVFGAMIGLLLAKPDPLQLARFFEEPESQQEVRSTIIPTPPPPIIYCRMIYTILGTTLGAIVGAGYGGYVADRKIRELRRGRSNSDT